ncbi:uncharacterized protein Orcokinin isoform X2 [Eurosta solidaginis]|uniref:uncharacterized protein Orcokinin isoform X2 n=1 Tax=Eurosta solidaginis TaxID=178769 RepID=UPI00353112A4
MKVLFLLLLAACVGVTVAMPSKVSPSYNDNYPLLKADFKNLNPDNIYIRSFMDMDSKVRNCMFTNSMDNYLCVLRNRCVHPECDLKKLLWYMLPLHESTGSASLDEGGWNSNKIKKNFDEIDKTSASFNTLNQLI